MNLRTTLTRTTLAIALLAGTIGVFDHAQSSRAATMEDFVRQTSSNLSLSALGGYRVTIASVYLPQGTWVVSATAAAVNWGPSDYTRCAIVQPDIELSPDRGHTTALVGDPNLPGAMGPGSYVASLATTAAVTASYSGWTLVELQCWHDSSTPSGYGPGYIDAGAVLWAHASAGLG